MATVTGFTAARMQEIEDNAVVEGVVSGNNLLLTKKDGSQINAGNVRGAQGIQGVAGEVSNAQLNAAIATVQEEISSTGRGLLQLVTVTNDQTVGSGNDGTWVNVTGAAVTFTPIAGRYYHFSGTVTCASASADVTFDMRITRDAGDPICAGLSWAKPANKNVPINADRSLIVPAGWAGAARTFRLQVRADSASSYFVRGNTGYPTVLSITDTGKP